MKHHDETPDRRARKRWRIAQNEWNLKGAPWCGAIGIEEDDNDVSVPALVCWFTRGWTEDDEPTQDHPAVIAIMLHNQAIDAGVLE